MRIQVASDLHLELLPEDLGTRLLVDPHPDAELLILAGDIHTGVEASRYFRDWPVPVLYVPGNHEFYGQAWEDIRERLREATSGTSIQILDNDAHIIDGVRFLGTTLWTDFAIDRARPAPSAMELAGNYLKDFFEIRTRSSEAPNGLITPAMILADHQASRAWLEDQLRCEFDGKTVVISHHAPHRLSVHRKYVGHPLTPAFASDLSDLMHRTDLWIHGHAHDSFDHQVGRCRVVSNPAGYSLGRRDSFSGRESLQLENPEYQASYLVVI